MVVASSVAAVKELALIVRGQDPLTARFPFAFQCVES